MNAGPFEKIKKYRMAVQGGFFVFIIYLGLRFWEFTRYYETGGQTAFAAHPDGVEGFLPIGALTSLKYWLVTGSIHPYHQAGLFILLGAVGVSAALKKGFCGWICPVGFISERLYKIWFRIFKKNIILPRWTDYPLRAIKYLLLFFFFWAIILKMDTAGLHGFLDGDYWKVADVKMLRFFTDISALALDIIVIIALLSVPIRNFWCRYLCPYGALLGIVAVVSPFEITRDAEKCNGCGNCKRNCPAHLPVDEKKRVVSPECVSCLTCAVSCPKSALSYSTPGGKRSLPGWAYPVILLGIFLGVQLAARLTGHWHSQVPQSELFRLVPVAGSLIHP